MCFRSCSCPTVSDGSCQQVIFYCVSASGDVVTVACHFFPRDTISRDFARSSAPNPRPNLGLILQPLWERKLRAATFHRAAIIPTAQRAPRPSGCLEASSRRGSATMPSRTSTLTQSADSDYLSSSLSGLSRSRSTNNLIVRAYKQATQLYLTRRFREAWEVLEPVVSPQQNSSSRDSGVDVDGADGGVAPVAQSSRGTRTKVWVFYLSLIHAVVELGAEEGKREFGAEGWRAVVKKAREGTVWDDIVARGYGGSEGDVDAEVVVNLATLLLGHMPTQALNQRKLEGYLAASEDVGGVGYDGTSTPMSTHSASPKALQARLKILELYTLHVLPENGEWEYAREFLEANDSLDEERKEAFVHALDTLKEEKVGTAQRERELQAQREREAEEAKKAAEDDARRRADEERKQAAEAEQARRAAIASQSSPDKPAGEGTGSQSKPPSSARAAAGNGHARPPTSSSSRNNAAARSKTPAPNNSAGTGTVLARLGHMVRSLRPQNLSPALNTRLVMFLLAFVLLLTRRDLRLRLRRAMADGWDKVRRTIGAGVKVSYV